MTINSRKVLINSLLIATSLSLLGTSTTFSMDRGSKIINEQEEKLTLKDTLGKEFLVYKVSAAGKRCGYRVFNITPTDMVKKLLANLKETVVYTDNTGKSHKKTIKEIIIADLVNTVYSNEELNIKDGDVIAQEWLENSDPNKVSDQSIVAYLNEVYVEGKVDEGELSSVLIPAVAYITDTNVDFYEFNRGQLILTYHVEAKNPNSRHIAFFYRLEHNEKHFDRLVPVAGARQEEIESAREAEKVYNYFNKYAMNLSPEATKQLRPENLNEAPSLSLVQQEELIKDIMNLINKEQETDENLLVYGFSRDLINEARDRLSGKPANLVPAPSLNEPNIDDNISFEERQKQIKNIIESLQNNPNLSNAELTSMGYNNDLINEAADILSNCHFLEINLKKNKDFIEILRKAAPMRKNNIPLALSKIDNRLQNNKPEMCQIDNNQIGALFPYLKTTLMSWNTEYYSGDDETPQNRHIRDQNYNTINNAVWLTPEEIMFAERQEKVKDIITQLNNESTDEELFFLGFTQDLIDDAKEILGFCSKFKQNIDKNPQLVGLLEEISRNGETNPGTKIIVMEILNRVENFRKGLQQEHCKIDYNYIKNRFADLLARMGAWNHERYTLRNLSPEELSKRDQNNEIIKKSVW